MITPSLTNVAGLTTAFAIMQVPNPIELNLLIVDFGWIKLTILNGNETIKEKNFNESFSYNNKNNKFDLTKYQSEVKNNLVDKIIEKMNIYFSLRWL